MTISSSRSARNPTFFGAGKRGRDCENDRRRLSRRGRGPFVNIDFALKGSLYGGSEGNESNVETEVADAAEEDGRSPGVVLAESGSSMRDGVKDGVVGVSTLVARGRKAGLLSRVPDFGLWVLRKVLRAVGEVAESVSNRRLVEPLPYIGLTFDVLSVSLGRFDGDGPTGGSAGWLNVLGAEGRIVSDIVLLHIGLEEVCRFGNGAGCGMYASIVPLERL